jgi:RNA polymerase sigma factor (sigma-70 family)
MSDYRVTVKVRNNRILKAMKEIGAEPGQKWCEANGLVYGQVNGLINMTESPLLKTGALSVAATKLCDLLGKLPEELWSNEQIRPLERNFTELDMTQEQVMALLPLEETSYIQDFGRKDFQEIMESALGMLRDRERKILQLHYYEDKTIDEIADMYDLTYSTIQQIERKALRKLRHPIVSPFIKPFLEGAQ